MLNAAIKIIKRKLPIKANIKIFDSTISIKNKNRNIENTAKAYVVLEMRK